MNFPEFNFIAHASEVVCVSIGANLLLPVAPEIMSRFFKGIEVDPDKIIEHNFNEELQAHLNENHLRKIGKVAVAIKRRQIKGTNNPGLFWKVIDVFTACIGVFLLWSGWVEHPTIAKGTLLLFLPSFFAAGYPFICFVLSRFHLWFSLKVVALSAWACCRHNKKKCADNNDEILDFINNAKQAIEVRKNGNGKQK